MEKVFITTNFEDTQKLGEEFASTLKPGDLVFLYGDLGSGKTTFTQGIAKGLGIKTRVISPTFIVLRTHITSSKKVKKLFHLDLYRLKSKEDVESIAIDDLINDPDAITLIEWPEILGEEKNAIKINFEYINEDTRKIEIENE